MAKDLPYFKFIISEWNDGDITLCSLEAQGLFINLCSLYWSQEGKLSITKCKRRYKDCNTTVWDELIGERIIKVNGDDIAINFLDEQFDDRKKQSAQNSKNVAKRWKNKESDTTVLRPYYDRNASVYNIEEKREEKKREEWERELFSDQQYVEGLQMTFKGKDYRKAFNECYNHHSGTPNPPQELWVWKQKLNTWLTRFKGESEQKNKYKVQ